VLFRLRRLLQERGFLKRPAKQDCAAAQPNRDTRFKWDSASYISVVFFSQALWRSRSDLKSISTFSASVAVNKQSFGSIWPQAPHTLWRRL